jgi:DNA invertase Pin-like site-specific DNA recombinase
MDTTSAHGRLLVSVLGAIAEFELALRRSRCDEGIKRAKANGVRFGRKRKLTPHQMAEAVRRRDAGEVLTEIARTFNVSHSTISRLPAEAGAVEIRGRTAAAKRLAPPLALLSTQQRLSNGADKL